MVKYSSKVEVLRLLRTWEGILRSFGCSEQQVRELYRLSQEDGLKIAEVIEEPGLSLELEAEDEARDQVGQLEN
jgi:hypothetical protein